MSSTVLRAAFIVYILIAGFTMSCHELWGDEIHSWNIAKASGSFSELISNTRYEGHPPLWYVILWTVSKLTHHPAGIQVIHLIIACAVVFLVLFYSPIPLSVKLLIPFGYFFLFEYVILSRDYAIGILMAFSVCILMHKNFKGKIFLYYILLFLLSNTSLPALFLAAGFQLYFLFTRREQREKNNVFLIHLLIGILILLPSVYFIYPPADSSLSTGYWIERWKINQLAVAAQAPLRAFIPVSAWQEQQFWDTQFLITFRSKFEILKWIFPFLSAALILFTTILLRKNRNALLFFLFNLGLVVLGSFMMGFTNYRHVGFIFIGFIIALWFYCYRHPLSKNQTRLIIFLLLFQSAGAVIAVSKDIKYTFSNAFKVKELLKEIPVADKVVTDYWSLNALAAFTDKPYYCIDLERETFYLQWNKEMKEMLKRPDRYSTGITMFLKSQQVKKVYMISIHPPEKMSLLDKQLFSLFRIILIDKRDGAIEKGGNLYLYEISSK